MKLLITAIIIKCFSYSHAQQLSVDETIFYIKILVSKYSTPNNQNEFSFDKLNEIKNLGLTISEYGKIELTFNESRTDFLPGSASREVVSIITFKLKDLETVSVFNGSKISFSSHGDAIEVRYDWNNPDKKKYFISSSLAIDLLLPLEANEKCVNAFKYLFSIAGNDPSYSKLDSDPFSKDQFRENENIISSGVQSVNKIPFKSNGGDLAAVSVSLSGNSKSIIIDDMIIDSGASDISISSSTERELINKGLITKENYIERGLYKLADGSIVSARRLKIPYVKIGAFSVKDVVCGVSPTGDVHLLGKSFLNRFSKWSIDNINKKLVLEK
ncbi:MAG TPA: retroviral-like aspartic protease family protein [Cyclobacteriaceae bacterium]|nr:retroviral-like aspartic protease family protein [Cyclobacteriaceae bacterium]